MIHVLYSSGRASSSFLLDTIDLAIHLHQILANPQFPHNFLRTLLAIPVLLESGGSLEGLRVDLEGMSEDAQHLAV
jgi:hypothetical protein